MKYSYSSINTYRTCPRQFQAKYITKEVKFKPSEAAEWGTKAHDAFDKYFREGTPLPKNMQHYQKWIPPVEKQVQNGGQIYTEHELAFDQNMSPVGWWDENVFVRGKIDVLIMKEDKAVILDWKTGKYRPNDELKFFSWLTFHKYPEVRQIKTIFIWLKEDAKPTTDVFYREHMDDLKTFFNRDITMIENSVKYDNYPMKPSGLCGKWCDVLACPHNGRKK